MYIATLEQDANRGGVPFGFRIRIPVAKNYAFCETIGCTQALTHRGAVLVGRADVCRKGPAPRRRPSLDEKTLSYFAMRRVTTSGSRPDFRNHFTMPEDHS